MLRKLVSIWLLLFVVLPSHLKAQDTIVFDGSGKNLNRSIADQFTIYSSDVQYDFIEQANPNTWKKMERRKIESSVENLDFTTQYHYVRMVLINNSDAPRKLYLETARPITNYVEFFPTRYSLVNLHRSEISGDGTNFNSKSVSTNRSVIPVYLKANDTIHGVLVVGSDGEAVTLPIIFWDEDNFAKVTQNRQFRSGIFYGIFIFVVIIYFTFFVLLRDRLFLIYTIYVASSGLLQFALDGYVHQYIFPSGGYMTHHSVILIAGTTVFLALTYATKYLKLQGRNLLISRIFLGLVAITTLASLIPGVIFETCYPLINFFSLLSLIFLLIIGLRIRKRRTVSPFFLTGLFLLLSGGMFFILGNVGVIDAPEYTQYGLKAGTLAEIICLSILMAGKYKELQDEKEAVQKQLVVELEEKNKLTEEANIRLEKEVAERTMEIEQKRIELAEKNQDLMDSINYAERIQSALLPPHQKIRTWFSDFFIFFQPKDILSGDFYWMEEVHTSGENPQRMLLYATADCTGHGVPGAFVSVVCNNLLKLSKIQKDVNTPGEALDFIDREINSLLNPEFKELEIRDGMDIALCAINFETMELIYAGAKIPLYLLRDGKITIYKGDRQAIGNDTKEEGFQFTSQRIELKSGDKLYTFSDGIPDQFGGPKDKKFLTKRLKNLLLETSHLSMEEQKKSVTESVHAWMKDTVQIDDMLLMGVHIP
ncbi:MAG: SpoIIE family protein phosphatase [bacterium]|nr:SpoIIE family protein phosphatase [bacterium]